MFCIKGKAMSNETDLDWLARNVHAWPTNTPKAILPGDATFKLGAVFYGDCVAFSGELWPEYRRVNKADWLARRAELQNKPSWGCHEFAVIAQGGNGYWYGSNVSEEKFGHEKLFCITGTGWNYICDGIVLGDWRDTLERRPDMYKSEPKIDTSAEHVQKMAESMRDWFERGELPPVGVVCEAYIDYPPQWVEAEIVAHKDGFAIGWCKSVMKGCHGDKAGEFRPVRTERDVLIEIIKKTYDTDDRIADAILAAGFKRGAA